MTLCLSPWQQQGAAGSAVCLGTSTTILPSTALASLPAGGQLVTGLSAGSASGVDHLRVRFSLPSGAPAIVLLADLDVAAVRLGHATHPDGADWSHRDPG